MLDGMMGKLKEAQGKIEESKKRMDSVTVTGEAQNGAVKVISTANRKITEISISDELIQEGNKEQIEELVLIATNNALGEAEKVFESEMQGAARGIMPNIPGMF
ncbi:MAG: hypothetical protein COC01_00675 [Bacteroidetes bacterium]|nr:YbaB/EbfC family nucleoid-associated protein [Bacteroidia bacterium]PCH69748.1 MAG: hypothetical protein COC01_00675 [Bacteroidota bacterium]